MNKLTIFFLGIGGISMSALANLHLSWGHTIHGSDAIENAQTLALRELGATIYIGHASTNIPHNCNLVIINGAIQDNTPELVYAKRQGIPIVDRSMVLAKVSRQYDNVIAVAGTHGKSTTTAMIAQIFKAAKKRPTIHNGALINNQNPLCNLEIGEKEFFITEACEFKQSFLTLKPTTAIITNINPDHMDCYKDTDELVTAFTKFALKSQTLIFNPLCKNSEKIKTRLTSIIETTNSPNKYNKIATSYTATDILEYKAGHYSFTTANMKIKLGVPGYHNIHNALLAIATAKEYNITNKDIVYGLKNFYGIARRFEIIGTKRPSNIAVVIDYAHHPEEIKTTIKTATSLYKNPLYIFQPHTYSRTKILFKEFASALEQCKVQNNLGNLILFKTYAAREKVIKGATAKNLAIALNSRYFATETTLLCHLDKILINEQKHLTVHFSRDPSTNDLAIIPRLEQKHLTVRFSRDSSTKNLTIIPRLKKKTPVYDAFIFVGAGNIDQIAQNFLKQEPCSVHV